MVVPVSTKEAFALLAGSTVSLQPSEEGRLVEGAEYKLDVAAGAMVDVCGRSSTAIHCTFAIAGENKPDSASGKAYWHLLWDAMGVWHYGIAI